LAARAGGDGKVRIWSVDGDNESTMSDVYALAIDWHPDGVRLALGGFEGEVQVVDTRRMEFVGAWPQHQSRVTDIAWRPDGSAFATASNDGTALIIDAGTGEIVTGLSDGSTFECLSWAPDGQRLAVGGWDNNVHILELDDPEASLRAISGHTAALHSVAWAPHGDRLVSTSGDGTARVWDAADGTQIGVMPAGEAFAAAWSPDGRLIATGSRDGTVRIWDAETMTLAQNLRHHEAVHSLAWSPDGERLLTGTEPGTVTLWTVGRDHLRRELTELARSLLTDAEIARLVPQWPTPWG
jgi:WD40 repeat protein